MCSAHAQNSIVISALTTVEIVSYMVRLERDKRINTAQRQLMVNHFLVHRQRDYLVVELDEAVLDWARDMLVRHPLRSLDALQLAGAFQVATRIQKTPIFVSADKRLLTAASAEGFAVEDPNTYP